MIFPPKLSDCPRSVMSYECYSMKSAVVRDPLRGFLKDSALHSGTQIVGDNRTERFSCKLRVLNSQCLIFDYFFTLN